VFNIPELDPKDPEKSYERDVKIIKDLIGAELNLKKDDVIALYRVGPKDSSSIRPIIMKFSSEEMKFKALKLRNLKYQGNDIYISHDRTKKEREERKLLVKSLRERRANGEENLFIKNGKIVKEVPFRANPQHFWG
jgi:hypothetical protein